jgi:polyvinyl alcohol dehydrogenase (cytochrome)
VAALAISVIGYGYARDSGRTPAGTWLFWGGNLHNTHNADAETAISPQTVGSLTPKWTFQTLGNVSAIPTVKDGRVYLMDWGSLLPGPPGGQLRVLDANSGAEIWSHWILDYSKNLIHNVSRTSPAVTDKLVIFGDNRNQAATLLTIKGDGASLYGVDKQSGNLVWKTLLDSHPMAVVTQSPVVYNGRVYVGVSSLEEAAARLPLGYQCCTFRGSMVAVDAATGQILWKTYLEPDNFGQLGHFSGAAVWGSSPSIDENRNQVYVATGNNYTLPTELQACLDQHHGDPKAQQVCFDTLDSKSNYAFSVLALDLDTGAIRWANKLQNYGAWTLACDNMFAPWVPNNPKNCSDLGSEDWDFGQAPMLYTAKTANGPRDLVATGQKSGVFWAFDADNGAVVWSTTVGPGGVTGGMEFGSATDGERIYTQLTNWDHTSFTLTAGSHAGETVNGGIRAALDAATGKLVWQSPDPTSALPQKGWIFHPYWGAFLGAGFFGVAMGPVSVANGVVFGGSMDQEGNMYALDARTGDVLWSFKSGGSVMSAPAIVDGVVYWGSGYDRGFNSNKFYAFSLPK